MLRPAGLAVLFAAASYLFAAPESNSYVQHNLVSDIRGLADHFDPNLVNPWGVSLSGSSPFWVSDNGTGLATVYDGHGRAFPMSDPLVVTIPQASGKTGPASPTGQVFNGTGAFAVAPGIPAVFLFATEDGTIAGWSPMVDRAHAVLKVDRSPSGAVYKGLAIGADGGGPRIYATNFHAGTVDVFDGNFSPVLAGAFADPNLPAGFAPFNIRNVNGHLFVTYAKQDQDAHDDVAGPGNGYVNEFDLNGVLIRRFASQGTLNSPWASH